MSLVPKNVGNAAYYTDGVNYFTFHQVTSKSDALWIFACMDLGITKRSGFSTDETTRINDLAGTGIKQKAKYLLLKNGQAVEMPYLITGLADLHINDIILLRVPAPAGPDLVICPHCASRVARGPVCSACGKPLTP